MTPLIALLCITAAIAEDAPTTPPTPAPAEAPPAPAAPPPAPPPTAEVPAPPPTAEAASAPPPTAEVPPAPTDPTAPPPAPAAPTAAPALERAVVGLALGPAVAFSSQNIGFSPRLEAGYTLPFASGRVRLTGAAQHLRSKTPGTLAGTPTESGGATWTLRTSAWMFGLGATVALLPPERALVPELGLLPELVRIKNRVEGESGGDSIGETAEYETRFGLRVGAGARYALGPGEAFGALEIDLSKYAGVIPSPVSAGVFAPRVGYRMRF